MAARIGAMGGGTAGIDAMGRGSGVATATPVRISVMGGGAPAAGWEAKGMLLERKGWRRRRDLWGDALGGCGSCRREREVRERGRDLGGRA